MSCNQPISISVMAAWQHPAVPDVPPRAGGALVSSAVLLQRSLRRKHIHTCILAHTVAHADTHAHQMEYIIVFPSFVMEWDL